MLRVVSVGDEHTFRKVRLDARDYVWLPLSSIRSVGWLDGQVLLETDTQTLQLDPNSDHGARSPEQILADALGEGKLSDVIPHLRAEIWGLIDRKKQEQRTVDYLKGQQTALLEEIRQLKADRARAGLSILEGGLGGSLALTMSKKE